MDYMKRALELAQKGRGFVNPNPLVGAVIVKNSKIIGEGWHECFGKAHAEINAFSNAVEAVDGAELYVTLEPCSHYGKTPPCAKTIVEKGIKKVYIGMKDPNPFVSGKGIEVLQEAGIEVVCGIYEQECKKMNEIFIKYITTKLPFVVMKTAMTLDGKIASYTGDSKWISCKKSREIVHKMRSFHMGVMVGIQTVLKDNPFLTARIENAHNPIPIIIDSTLKIPENAHVLEGKRCIIATTDRSDEQKRKILEAKGAEIIQLKEKNGHVDLKLLLNQLGKMGIDSILLEGGGELNFSMLENQLIDKVIFFLAPKLLGGRDAKTSLEGIGFPQIKESIQLKNIEIKKIEEDIFVTAYPIYKEKGGI